ncbi:hypothetical protein P5673_028577 [Acropora cervicornis]|uniref:Uncharacterized protein n=1 Tax=Acropora cervicornis TaxID=6130 RepID=A0AAD9PX55_ACRCE|nr:hypothetical protein P5673_028577 [Acropora cervicornis]
MAIDQIIRLSSLEVLDTLKEVSTVVHQLVPEKEQLRGYVPPPSCYNLWPGREVFTPGQLLRKKVHLVTAVKFTLQSGNAQVLEEVWNLEVLPLEDVLTMSMDNFN